MGQIIYKTQPRLFDLCITILGFIFFGLLFLLTLQSAQDKYNWLTISVLVLFAFASLTSLFYFLNIKTIKLTTDNLIISYLLLPISKTINYTEIRNIQQRNKPIKALIGVSWESSYIYSNITTSITLVDNKLIKLNSVGQIDFEEFYKTFNKLKRGERKFKIQKRHFLLYLLDNFDGLLWIILLAIMTIGLGYGIFTKQ